MDNKIIRMIPPFTGWKNKKWRICGREKCTARAGIKGYDGPTNGRYRKSRSDDADEIRVKGVFSTEVTQNKKTAYNELILA